MHDCEIQRVCSENPAANERRYQNVLALTPNQKSYSCVVYTLEKERTRTFMDIYHYIHYFHTIYP